MDTATTTSLEPEPVLGTIPTWITGVSAIHDVTARIRQITVTGGLDDFTPLAPDQFVYVLATPHGRRELTIDASFSWDLYREMPEAERPVGAYYTIRRWDPQRRSLDLWVVLHGHDGGGQRWARTTQVGDPVGLWGPRDAFRPPSGCSRMVLFGDETALPAIAAIVESLASTDTATVIVSVADVDEVVPLASAATLDIRWVTATEADPNPLLTAVRERSSQLGGSIYVWGGAESRDITAVRRYLRSVIGLSRHQLSLTGYWRRTAS